MNPFHSCLKEQKISDRTIIVNTCVAFLLLLLTGGGLLYIFFGEFGRNDFSKVPIQKRLSVSAVCPDEIISTSYVVNAHRTECYIAISFYGTKSSADEGFALHKCKQLRVFTHEIKREAMSFGNTHDFEHIRRTSSDKDLKIDLKQSRATGWMTFDTKSINPETSSFSLDIPIDNLLTRNEPDTWALDVKIVSLFLK